MPAPIMDLPAAAPRIDPTPGPNDVTSFEQVKGGPPARHPTLPTAPAARPAPAPSPASKPASTTKPAVKEVHLDTPSDPNRANQIPAEILEGIEALATPEGGVEEGGRAKAKAEAVEPEAVEPAAAEAEPAAAEPPAADPDAELDKIVQSGKTLKEVRTAHKEALKRERALKAAEAEWQKKLADAESRASTYKPEVVEAERKELEATKKRVEELEATVRTLDYTKSAEFHEKHVKPIADALENAYQDLSEMLVTASDGQQRAATREDFQELLKLPLPAATAKAKEMFGDMSGNVLSHRSAVVRLERARKAGMENAAKDAEASRQRQLSEQTQRAERLSSLFKRSEEEVANAAPELFKAREGDEEGNQWLEKGRTLVSALDSNDLSEEDRVKVGAMLRHRASAFPRVLFDLQKAVKERDAALAKLAKYEKSAPRDGDGTTGGPPAEPADPMERALRSIDKMATRNPAYGS